MYKNAFEGIKKIHKGEILSMIATVLSVVGGILGISGLQAGEGTSSGDSLLVIAGILVIVGAVLAIIAIVLNISGVSRASKDEAAFKNALIVLGVGFAANLLITIFSKNQTISSIGKTITTLAELLASYFVCTGIINLADRIGNKNVSDRGKKIRTLLMGIWLVSAVLNALTSIFQGNQTMEGIIVAVAVVGGIVSIVAYFLYIGLLGRAKKMLES